MPGITASSPPKVVVTFVIDGGGWNVLQHWPDSWPNLKSLMGTGANFRNAITGSFPAVTACAHASIGTGTFPSQHGITGHNIRDGSKVQEGVRRRRPREPRRHLDPHARGPLERRHRRPRVGRRDRLPGLAHGHDRPRRSVPNRRDAAGRGLLGRGRVQAERCRRVGAAQPRSVPDAVDRARPRRVRRPSAGVRVARVGPVVRPAGTPDAVLRAARRAVSGRPDRGDAPQRADRAERRHGPPLHQLQGAGLHRPHLQHEVRVGGPRPAGGRRTTRTAGRDPR